MWLKIIPNFTNLRYVRREKRISISWERNKPNLLFTLSKLCLPLIDGHLSEVVTYENRTTAGVFHEEVITLLLLDKIYCKLFLGCSMFTCSSMLSWKIFYSWFATTWQGGHVGGQNKRIFPRRICMKIVFGSQRREMLLFLTTNMAAVTSSVNQQYSERHSTYSKQRDHIMCQWLLLRG